MAGFMRKQNGHVYDGANMAAEPLVNGVFVEITAEGVKLITATKDTAFRIEEKTDLWGLPAIVLNTVATGKDDVYLCENELDYNDSEEYDESKYVQPVGRYVRMHRPLIGEQLIMTVDNALFATLAVGDIVQPAAGGAVAKQTGEVTE